MIKFSNIPRNRKNISPRLCWDTSLQNRWKRETQERLYS